MRRRMSPLDAKPRVSRPTPLDGPSRSAGVAAGVVNSLLQIGSAVGVTAIGGLFFSVLGGAHGEPAYAHAFGVAMIAVVTALGLAMLATTLRD